MNIHIDTEQYDPCIPITGGRRYLKPPEPIAAIACPNCARDVTQISSVEPAYLRNLTDEFGTQKKDRTMPPCPVPGFESEILFCAVSPCGCRVSSAWAGAFMAERTKRLAGNAPKPVVAYTPQDLERVSTKLTDALAKLYTLQATAEGQQKTTVDYWVVIIADQIQRLHPGRHNIAATPQSLDPAVRNWANARGHTMPTDPVDPFELNPVPVAGDEYGADYPMPPQFRNSRNDSADALAYATMAASQLGQLNGLVAMPGIAPPHIPPRIPPVIRGTEGAARIRMPEKPTQIELPESVIAQVIGVIDHHGTRDEVVGVLNLMLEQGGKRQDGAGRLELLSLLRRHLVQYQSAGTELHANAYYFVTTLLSYVDLSHPGTKAVPVMKPKPFGKTKLPVTTVPEVDKLARKRRTIRRLKPDDGEKT